jgi:hypothetical protein
MEVTLELVYLCAVVFLTIGLLLWFILGFVPSMLGVKRSQDRRE